MSRRVIFVTGLQEYLARVSLVTITCNSVSFLSQVCKSTLPECHRSLSHDVACHHCPKSVRVPFRSVTGHYHMAGRVIFVTGLQEYLARVSPVTITCNSVSFLSQVCKSTLPECHRSLSHGVTCHHSPKSVRVPCRSVTGHYHMTWRVITVPSL